MKFLRFFSILVFILSVAAFGLTLQRERLSDNGSGPSISFEETTLEVSVHVTEEELLKGVTAKDIQDGDVSASLIVEDISTFMEDGSRLVTYAAFDSDGHVTKAARRIRYTDYTTPEFDLSAPMYFMTGSAGNILEHVRVSDCIDGDVTNNILIYRDSKIDMDVPGDYGLRLKVANSAGDVAVLPLKIHVTDPPETSKPQISLSQYAVYTDLNKQINPKDYIAKVVLDGQTVTKAESSFPSVSVSGDVNYAKPGVYPVRYSLVDTKGNVGNTELVVIVKKEGINLATDENYGLVINGWDDYTGESTEEPTEEAGEAEKTDGGK